MENIAILLTSLNNLVSGCIAPFNGYGMKNPLLWTYAAVAIFEIMRYNIK
jgi:hypothetical protein